MERKSERLKKEFMLNDLMFWSFTSICRKTRRMRIDLSKMKFQQVWRRGKSVEYVSLLSSSSMKP